MLTGNKMRTSNKGFSKNGIDLNDFIGSVGYDHFFGEYFSLGGNFGFYEGETVVQDVDFTFTDDSPIFRDVRLEIVPLEIALKVLPLGREAAVIPYMGGGAGLYYWEYEEVGDFVIDRNTDPTIVAGTAFSDGWNGGWHVEGGVQIPVSRAIALQFEAKYWKAEGDRSIPVGPEKVRENQVRFALVSV